MHARELTPETVGPAHFEESALELSLIVPAALRLWHGLSLGALAPLPTGVLAKMFGLSPEQILPLLKTLAEAGIATEVELVWLAPDFREQGWQLAHPLLGDWGRGALPAYAQTLPTGGFDQQEVQQLWQNWWLQFLGEHSVRGVSAGTEHQYTALVPHFGAVLSRLHATDGPAFNDYVPALKHIAFIHRAHGRSLAAEPLLRQALEVVEQLDGPDAIETLDCLSNLAALLHEKRDLAGAEALYRRAFETRARTLGSNHPNTLASLHRLARLLREMGDAHRAAVIDQRLAEATEQLPQPDRAETLQSALELAEARRTSGDLAGAEPLYRRVIASRERMHGKGHTDTCQAALGLALLLAKTDRAIEARQFAGQAYEGFRAQVGGEHEDTQRARRLLDELGSEQKE